MATNPNPLIAAIQAGMAANQQNAQQPQVSSSQVSPEDVASQIGPLSGNSPVYTGPVDRGGIVGLLQRIGRGVGITPGDAQARAMQIQAEQQRARADAELRAAQMQNEAAYRTAALGEESRHNQATEGIGQENADTERQGVQQTGQYQTGELANAETRNQISQEQTDNELQLGQQRNALEAKKIASDNALRM